ncbi:MAG: metallophosphoesterase [Bdellovibrionales bacterium]
MHHGLPVFSIVILFPLLLLLAGCFPFRDSPYSDDLLHDESELNPIAKTQLNALSIDEDGVVRIAIFADPHQNYRDLGKVIRQINRTENVDFVVVLGDITNNSLNFEYDQFLKDYKKLRYPSFMIPGNHDLLGAGKTLYRRIFGPANYIFESANFRFVFFNSNNLEDPGGFDPEWLLARVNETSKRVVVFTHVPLTDKERYHGKVAEILNQVVVSPKVEIIINGHNHGWDMSSEKGTHLVQCPRVEGQRWILFELDVNSMAITRIPGRTQWTAATKPR